MIFGPILAFEAAFSGEALRGLLRSPSFEGFFNRFSGADMLRQLRGLGIEIRTQDFYDIRRDVLGLTKYQEQIERLNPERPVPRAWIAQEHGWELSQDFHYRFRVTGSDPNTGEEIESFFAISSDTELTKEQAQNTMTSMLLGEEEFYGISPDEVEMYSALARPGIFPG